VLRVVNEFMRDKAITPKSPQAAGANPSYREAYDYLPDACVQLLESAPDGEALMHRVVDALGGQVITIPTKLFPGCKLSRILGENDAARVWKVWRGKGTAGEIKFYMPAMATAKRKQSRLKLLQFLSGGVTVSQAAASLGLSQRTIHKMLRKARELGERAPSPNLSSE
jgi:Helix-turn-helix domain